MFDKGPYYIDAGRMAAGTRNAKLELLVNEPTRAADRGLLANPNGNPAKMAAGQERD